LREEDRNVTWNAIRLAIAWLDPDQGGSVRSRQSLIFNAQTNQIEYYYLSRLPGESIGGVADRHVHPAEPLAVAARF
jgi:hypothetical protein